MSIPNDGRDLFTNLPLELLHEIAGYLPLHHQLKLRAVFSKAQEDTVAELVGPILKTIYLSPSAHSICKFHRLLSSAFYRRQIRTVVYIPRTISRWRLERTTYLHELDFTHNISLMEPLADWSYDLYKTTHDEHMEGDFSMFANYFLAADLAQLSRLSHLVVADGADVVGLNASRLWCGHAHVEERWRLGLSVLRKAAQGIAAERMLELRDDQMNDDAALHDTALFLAAEQGQMKPAVLTLDFPKSQSLKRVTELLMSLLPKFGKHSVIFNVRNLEIGLPCMTDESSYRKECANAWSSIANAATQLEKLKIVVENSTDSFMLAASPRAVDHFLRNERYAKLQILELTTEKYSYGCISAKEFLQWMKQYGSGSQLREIKLKNILLVPFPGECYASEIVLINKSIFKQGIRDVLLEARKLGLRSFEMKIDRVPQYTLPHSPFASARSAYALWFDELAEEMQVRLGKDSWDFGEHVMDRRWKDNDLFMEDAWMEWPAIR